MTRSTDMESILVSACLLGEPCRYDGKSSLKDELVKHLRDKNLIAVCPEVEGGLPTPRPPAEIQGKKVYRQNGMEVTDQFNSGSHTCVQKCLEGHASLAILKSRSPACGCGHIYDGSFTGTLIEGDGVFTRALKRAGINCISDENYQLIYQSNVHQSDYYDFCKP